MLDHLGQPGAEVALGQGVDGLRVDDDQAGLVKGADQVLGRRVVDGGLAAAGGVDLGQDGGGELHEVDAPHVGGGGEARHVPDGAAAQGDHRRRPVEPRLEEGVPAALGHGQPLGRLAIGDLDDDHLEPALAQVVGHGLAVQANDLRRAHEGHAPADAQFAQVFGHAPERPALHDDRVGLRAELDGNVHRRRTAEG